MYTSGSVLGRFSIFIILHHLFISSTSADPVQWRGVPQKCCQLNSLFNEHLTCVNRIIINDSGVVLEKPVERAFQCLNNESLVLHKEYRIGYTGYLTFSEGNDSCIEDTSDGKTIIAKCANQPSAILGLGSVIFWGAQTYMSTNLAHMILCIVVVLVYLSVPELGRGLYNRAVVRHNICLLMQGVVLQLLGYCELKNCWINHHIMIFLWLTLQYFTIATVFWLNGICFDMTLAITKFRWIAQNAHKSSEVESRKLLMYGIFAWGGPLLPTLLAALCDYIPQVPRHFVLKPNYLNYRNGPSAVVNLYFFLLPAFVLLLNNILFVFTTHRIVRIQRSTEIATRNQKNILTKKYYLFLRLYLLMGAPWFFGMVLACLNILIVLKICRMIQPILWLLMLTTHKAILKRVKQVVEKCKHRRKEENSSAPPSTVSSND
ncbi:probable G-protein coupled receptor Mth-like 1 [Diachasma alloeum]|uniref:probable G-protein coupled receptor Mth-like 1 n=1 Tax=Diachasma alloeum TaxID=454923 RepID=UPI0007381B80|nr:probable G-protein coupled receptor Mth-like 1 [Diachasma alloeum]